MWETFESPWTNENIIVKKIPILYSLKIIGGYPKHDGGGAGLYFFFSFIEFHCNLWHIPLNRGLSKHQEVCFTPVTKVDGLILILFDLLGAI